MKISEVRKKVMGIRKLLSEYDMPCALVRSMQKCEGSGLEIDQNYLNGAKKTHSIN